MIKMDDVRQATARHFNLTPRDLLRRTHLPAIVRARQLGITVAREVTSGSLPQIAWTFGLCDHSMAIHSIKRTKQRLAIEGERVVADIQAIKAAAEEISQERARNITPLPLALDDSTKESTDEICN